MNKLTSPRFSAPFEEFSRGEPFAELRPAAAARSVSDRDGDRLLLADENDKPLAARDAGVEQIALQHRVVLGHDRDDDRRILRALALVNGRSIGGNDDVGIFESVSGEAQLERDDIRFVRTTS